MPAAAGDSRPPGAPRPAERRPRVLERGFEFRGTSWTARVDGATVAAASSGSGAPVLHVRFEPAASPPPSSPPSLAGYVVAADLADVPRTELQDLLADRLDAAALSCARPAAAAEGRRPPR